MNDAFDDRWSDLLRVTRSWRLEWHLDQLINRLAADSAQILKLQRGLVFLLDAGGLTVHGARAGADAAWLKSAQHVAQQVVKTGKPIFAHAINNRARKGLLCCVPLTAVRGVLGALYVDSSVAQKSLTSNDQKILEMLGLHAAAALEHALLYQSAITDPLTGLYTHRHFQREVEQALRRAVRADEPVSLMLIDLDHFKQLNDTCGHEAGNKCLLHVARILKTQLRATDVVARFGGDEFECLLPGANMAAAKRIAEKIRRSIGSVPGKVRVTGTIGIAVYPFNAGEAQALFLRADEALYQAKEAGRNRVCTSAVVEKAAISAQRKLKAASGNSNGTQARLETAPPLQATLNTERPTKKDHIDGHAVVGRLGMGSAGEVLLVRQAELGREIALKRPLTPHLTPDQLQAFEREVRTTAGLNHPGVVTVLTMGRDADQRRYYTMKLINGRSLEQLLEGWRPGDSAAQPTCTIERLLEILQRTAETIAYAHEKRTVHLDLTPSNIMVGEFGEVMVIDWGRGANYRTPSGRQISATGNRSSKFALVGSPVYTAPEQLPGSRQSPQRATDVFLLGALLYQVLTGRPPYQTSSLRQTIDAIRRGALVKPEDLVNDGTVDPALSTLCQAALSADPAQRPTALEFSRRLGSYVRKENEWVTTRFDAASLSREFRQARGGWRFAGNEIISKGPVDNIILWRRPVPGNFKLVCECWNEGPGELSLFCRSGNARDHDARENREYKLTGYLFQFGGDDNTATRLNNLVTIPGLVPKPGKRYRLEIECSGRWVYCSIDGKRVIAHRELFARTGSYIGFYAFGSGAHYRPIEVRHQRWEMRVSALRAADKFHEQGVLDLALEMYTDIAAQLPEGSERAEAHLKRAICLGRMQRYKEAREIFRTLKNSALADYALAHEALMEVRTDLKARRERGITLFNALIKKYPQSPARSIVHEAIAHVFLIDRTLTSDLRSGIQIAELGKRGTKMTQREMQCGLYQARNLARLAEWQRSLKVLLTLKKDAGPKRFWREGDPLLVSAALAAGRNDLVPQSPREIPIWLVQRPDWPSGILLHCAVRKKFVHKILDGHKRGLELTPRAENVQSKLAIMLCMLATGDVRAANAQLWDSVSAARNETDERLIYIIGGSLVESGCEEMFEKWFAITTRRHTDTPKSPCMRLLAALRMRWFIEHQQLDQAAAVAAEYPILPDSTWWNTDAMVLATLLSSLKLIGKSGTAKFSAMTSGTPHDLISMLAGEKAPVPGVKWPDASWQRNWRLWLAIWLEAQGRSLNAREIIKPAMKYNYGSSYNQPALNALSERLTPSLLAR